MEMYLFISENEVDKYDGETLKLYIGQKLTRIYANPTEETLREFGFKPLVEGTKLEEKEGYYAETYYVDELDSIVRQERYVEMSTDVTEE